MNHLIERFIAFEAVALLFKITRVENGRGFLIRFNVMNHMSTSRTRKQFDDLFALIGEVQQPFAFDVCRLPT